MMRSDSSTSFFAPLFLQVLIALLVAVLVAPVALSCSDDGPGTVVPIGRRPEVLANLGENIILPTYRENASLSAALTAAVDAYAGSPSTVSRDAARVAWAELMATYEEVEMMQLGPLGAMGDVVGGQDIRFEMYAWPSLNRCTIDQDTVSVRYDDATALAAETIDRRGLGAIEYLLFIDTPANACSPLSPINADGTWAAFTPEEIEARRARHAHSLAVIVQQNADRLVSTWEGGFLLEMTDPTRMGAVYGSAQEGLQGVTDALFYLDRECKDMKLAEPAGIAVCATPTCPESRESRQANLSKEHLVANLRAFSHLYHGGAPGGPELGFDDLLRDMDAGAFADSMSAHIAAAIVALEAIPGSLFDALSSDLPAVRAAYDAIKLVTDDLKTMFLTVLDLEAPDRAAGDND